MSQLLPLQIHTHSALLANWALVRSLHVKIVASFVQVMPARHGDYSGGRREEMIAANRTIALSSPREAFVRGGMRDGYANIAALRTVSAG